MHDSITAIVLTDRNTEEAELTIKSLESFAGELVERAVVIDYESVGGEDSLSGFATLINNTVRDYDIQTDFLIIRAGIVVTPETVTRLVGAMDLRPGTGIITGLLNGTGVRNQILPPEISDYKKAVEFSATAHDDRLRRVFIADESAFLVRKAVFDELGGLNEGYKGFKHAYFDYNLRLAVNGYNVYVVKNAVFWNTTSENKIDIWGQRFIGEDIPFLRDTWDMGYFNSQGNFAIIDRITQKKDAPIKVLEIGCSKGDTLLEISEEYPNSSVYGAEISEAAVRFARNYCNVILNNIEEENLPYEEGFFDYIIFGDVLEHLHNPAKTLKYVKRFLGPEGKVLISVPNVQHISVVKDLLNGNFT